MTWPFFTGELKSTLITEMRPDTCEPTCTVTSADERAGRGDARRDVAARDLGGFEVVAAGRRL